MVLYYRDRLDDPNVIFGLLITYFTGFATTLILRKIYQKISYRKRSISIIATIIIISTIITASLWFWFDTLLTYVILNNTKVFNDLTFNRYLSWILSNSIVIFLWSSLYFSIKLRNDWIGEKVRAEKANALAHKAQLQMLRYQLNPHFLFNSLNSIRALIEEDKQRAKSMITELSEFLRYSLVNENYTKVPLNKEVEVMKKYFTIEKTRFEEKLEVSFQIDKEAENILIPSFLLHPIFENAIKYGMKTTKLPLHISLKINLINNILVMEICNSGNWINESQESNSGTGTGLKNVQQRLLNEYPDKHKFKIVKETDSVCVKIELLNIEKNYDKV